MKEFRTKMQSIFPAIPKNSESTVEWEDLLKSKWKTFGAIWRWLFQQEQEWK